MNEKRNKLTALTVSAILAAAALAASFFERTLTAGLPSALAVTAIKAGFTLLTAGPTAAMLSLCGGLLSALTMFLLLKIRKNRLSYAGVSAVGGVMHNVGQLAAASALVGSAMYLNWLPILLLSGAGFGLLTGVILNAVMPALVKLKWFR